MGNKVVLCDQLFITDILFYDRSVPDETGGHVRVPLRLLEHHWLQSILCFRISHLHQAEHSRLYSWNDDHRSLSASVLAWSSIPERIIFLEDIWRLWVLGEDDWNHHKGVISLHRRLHSLYHVLRYSIHDPRNRIEQLRAWAHCIDLSGRP